MTKLELKQLIKECIKENLTERPKFQKNFYASKNIEDMDLRLKPEYVFGNKIANNVYSKKHLNGWIIKGEIHEDYYEWVDKFEASHPKYGKVWGQFNRIVFADSKSAFDTFVKNFPPFQLDLNDV